MSTFRTSNSHSYKTGEDLSGMKYRFVKRGEDRLSVVLAEPGDKTLGVLMNDPRPGANMDAAVAMPGGGALLRIRQANMRGTASVVASTNGKGGPLSGEGDEWVGAILDIGTEQQTIADRVYPVIVMGYNEGIRDHDALGSTGDYDHQQIDQHIDRVDNPHDVSLAQLGSPSVFSETEKFSVTTSGQTDFPLSKVPAAPESSMLVVNNLSYDYGDYWQIVEEEGIWLARFDPVAADFELEPVNELGIPDRVVVHYQT